MKEPGPDHPITIALHDGRVRIVVDGTVVAETARALALKEASYPTVIYVPREDARWDHFTRTIRTTHCPYKGEASHYDVTVGGRVRAAAAWSYEDPFAAVARIKDHLAFYPDKVDAIENLSA